MGFSKIAKLIEERENQKFINLRNIFWVTAVLTLFLAITTWIDNDLNSSRISALLLATSACSLFGVNLVRLKRFISALVLVTLMAFIVLELNMLFGNGIHDPGIIAFPLVIFIGGLLFSKVTILYYATLSILAIGVTAYLEINKLVPIPQGFTTDWEDVIAISAILIATAVIAYSVVSRTEQHDKEVSKQFRLIEESYGQVLLSWSRALEFRHSATHEHTERVANLALKLARILMVGEEEMEIIYRGAILHDIGKIGIPDSILLKKGVFTPEEMDIMKQHPIIGKEMVSEIQFVDDSQDIIHYHHEKWDGSGYPIGLKALEIPLSARIFSVVDVWDALTSPRPYREAWSMEDAKTYLNDQKGKHFDPRIVDIFLDKILKES